MSKLKLYKIDKMYTVTICIDKNVLSFNVKAKNKAHAISIYEQWLDSEFYPFNHKEGISYTIAPLTYYINESNE